MLNVLHALFAAIAFGQTNPPGFAGGNSLNAVPISGEVQVTCSGFNGESAVLFQCRDMVLEPNAYDHFMGPREADFKWVELVAERPDGSVRVKTVAYDGARGATKEPLNLWISTIFQKGLLAVGLNQISYKLSSKEDNRGPFVTGKFEAIVNRTEERECARGVYESTDINDCNSHYSVCQRYFAERGFCK